LSFEMLLLSTACMTPCNFSIALPFGYDLVKIMRFYRQSFLANVYVRYLLSPVRLSVCRLSSICRLSVCL